MEKETTSAGGRLYLAATPIGNLGDMTRRGLEVLAAADLIAAEDTRHTRKLLAHYDIHTPLTSYHEHNKSQKGAELIAALQVGKQVVCVSDAGLPGIADPGSDLVKLAIAAGIPVSPLPGANAALSALICSGLSTEAFTFVGFLPPKKLKRQEILTRLAAYPETIIFYEAPHRLIDTLAQIAACFGKNRPAALAREMTKKFEEFQRGTLGELIAKVAAVSPRGEYVLVVAGKAENTKDAAEKISPADILAYYDELFVSLGDKKEAMRRTAKHFAISRRDVYSALLTR
ncbi:MAG: 16S rRNA (cytidine(1402)-2'-O)-methyltransferase [Selenomonadaceae bacterium]|nr:16S rRNA (cytidine(1402)-2'-O)-methyltransferase [Selenomonadaceae bacterium]